MSVLFCWCGFGVVSKRFLHAPITEWKVARSGGSRAALWRMVIDHAGKPRAGYCDDEDKFIVVMLSELGYAMQPWEELRQVSLCCIAF